MRLRTATVTPAGSAGTLRRLAHSTGTLIAGPVTTHDPEDIGTAGVRRQTPLPHVNCVAMSPPAIGVGSLHPGNAGMDVLHPIEHDSHKG